jgi:hypothetical protein
MQTFTGQAFYPLDPRAEDIDPRDIAHALAMTCRYGGHVTRFYSVAEHCVLMSHAVPAEHALWALLHDAGEAYLSDVIRPIKRSAMMAEYRHAEGRLMFVIGERFGLPTMEPPSEVGEADLRILLDERAALLSPPPQPWADYLEQMEPLGVRIEGRSPVDAERIYLERFNDLTV